jgi:hypothetical protein
MLRLRFFLISDTDKAGLNGPDELRQLGEALSDIYVTGEFDVDGCGDVDKGKVDFTVSSVTEGAFRKFYRKYLF